MGNCSAVRGHRAMSYPGNVDVIVMGASGFIGSRVAACLSQVWITVGTWHTNQAISVEGCVWQQLDIRKRHAVLNLIAERLKPKVVIHIAGTKDIEFCQANPEEAWRLHVEGTNNVVDACKKIDARVVYISTDCVFNGRKERYVESDATGPFNTYGATKLAGERIVLDSDLKSLIIRTSLLFGWSLPGQASNYVIQVLKSLKERGSVEAATNLYNTPALVDFAAEIIAKLAMDSSVGIIHLAGKDRVSRYEFAQLVARVSGLEESRVIPVFDRTGLRQPNSCLGCLKLENLIETHIWGIEESLHNMVTMGGVSSRVRWIPQ